MFKPQFHISQTLLATLKRVAVQVYVLNSRRPTGEVVSALRDEIRELAAAAIGRDNEQSGMNYCRTWLELGESTAADFDLALLLRIHFRLGSGVMPEEQRGRLRRARVADGKAVTSVATYQPPEPNVVPAMLKDLVAFVEEERATLDPLLLAGIFHRQLLLIRPFENGNEPAAWLATRILLSGLGLERLDLLALEDHFRADRSGYLAALGARSENGGSTSFSEFTPWLEYFAEGIATALVALDKRYRQRQATPASSLHAHHRALLEHVDEHGYITDKQYARLTDRAKATRSLDFKKLIELDLLVREGRGRGTFYRRKP